jgi:hypothetical protein
MHTVFSRETTRRSALRWAQVVGIGGMSLAMAMALGTGLDAQGRGRSRAELVAKLTGKPVRVDQATGRRRALTEQEAIALIDHVASMTTRTATASEAPVPRGGAMLSVSGHGIGHVLVSRPNEDGTSSVRCVTSVDEAVDFLSGDADGTWPVSE